MLVCMYIYIYIYGFRLMSTRGRIMQPRCEEKYSGRVHRKGKYNNRILKVYITIIYRADVQYF